MKKKKIQKTMWRVTSLRHMKPELESGGNTFSVTIKFLPICNHCCCYCNPIFIYIHKIIYIYIVYICYVYIYAIYYIILYYIISYHIISYYIILYYIICYSILCYASYSTCSPQLATSGWTSCTASSPQNLFFW